MEISSLKDELNKWYDDNCKNGNLAWSYLAKKSGVTASNIRKIAKGEVGQPRFETTKQLLQALYPNQLAEVYVVLKELFPNKTDTWHLGETHNRVQFSRKDLEVTRDPMAFLLFKRAMTGAAKVKDLEDELGKSRIEQSLAMLADAGLAREDSKGFLVRCEGCSNTLTNDIHRLADEFRHVTQFLESKLAADVAGVANVDRQTNRFDSLHLGLNEKGSKELDDDIRALKEKIIKLLNDPEYAGDIPRFVNIAVGRFDSK